MASPLNGREEGSQRRSWEGRKEVWGGGEIKKEKKRQGRGEAYPAEPQYPPSSEASEHSVQHWLPHRPEISVCWQSALPAPVWCYYNSNPLVKTISVRRLQNPFSFSRLNNLHRFFSCCGEEKGHQVYVNHVKVAIPRRPLHYSSRKHLYIHC